MLSPFRFEGLGVMENQSEIEMEVPILCQCLSGFLIFFGSMPRLMSKAMFWSKLMLYLEGFFSLGFRDSG